DFDEVCRTLHTFKRLDGLRQGSDGAVLGNAVLAPNLSLHLTFAQRVLAVQHPAEYRVMLCRWSLRVSQPDQVRVRPTIALLILHGLMREVIRTAFRVPAANGVAQAATPTTHCVHVFGEVEQVRADAADLVQVRECVSLRLRITMRHDE